MCVCAAEEYRMRCVCVLVMGNRMRCVCVCADEQDEGCVCW